MDGDDVELEIQEAGGQDLYNEQPEDDYDMEEGELSDNDQPQQPDLRRTLQAVRKKSLHERLGPRVNRFAREDMDRAKLPDLVQQLGSSGVTHDPNYAEKFQARAKRFQLEQCLPEPAFADVQQMYDSLQVPKEERSEEYRYETILVTGFPKKINTDDLKEYFKEFNPIQYEWCDGKSANIIWGLDASAAKAMCYLSRPITDSEEVMASTTEDLVKKFETSHYNDPIDAKSFGLPEAPPGGPWRIGKPSALGRWKEAGTSIFMRLSRKSDTKPVVNDRDLIKKNSELRFTGGLLSSSKRGRLMEAVAHDQRMHEEHEKSKKYEPGSKAGDVWGNISADWTGMKKMQNDFQDDLRDLANQLSQRSGGSRR